MKKLPLLVFLVGLLLAFYFLFTLEVAGNEEATKSAERAFLLVFGIFTYLALMGWLGRLVAVPEKKDLGMFLSFILGPFGIIVAAILRSDNAK